MSLLSRWEPLRDIEDLLSRTWSWPGVAKEGQLSVRIPRKASAPRSTAVQVPVE